jgi:glycosyltransferase involved in cell wall biosynthesis
MKLLILTQKVDVKDPVLGFFHRWVVEFAKYFESIIVICLSEGEHSLPKNVRVLSLGKENGESFFKYIRNFFRFIVCERENYDAIFVHMNQEYVLLGSVFWKIFGKKVTMWRNHHAGNFLTRTAVVMCDRVFCTSKFSYTAEFKKTVLMPVGIDTDIFNNQSRIPRIQKSILFLGRISPTKRPDLFIDAIKDLCDQGVYVTATIVGDPLPKDIAYYESLKSKVHDYNLDSRIVFKKGVPNTETVAIYNAHEIFVNLSSSGMYDKTIFEAMACGTLSIASNENLCGIIDKILLFREGDRADLVEKLAGLLNLPTNSRVLLLNAQRKLVEDEHSLGSLGTKIQKLIISIP